MKERWLWWAKRDLRTYDNAALRHLVDSDHECAALYVFEPSLGRSAETSAFHGLAQRDALLNLKARLEAVGGTFCIVNGEVVEVLEALYKAVPFTGIVSHEETGSDVTFTRDKAVAKWATRRGVQWLEFPQNGVIRGLESRSGRQKIIWQRIWDTPLQSAPRKICPWRVEPSELHRLPNTLKEFIPAQSPQPPNTEVPKVPDVQTLLDWARPNTGKLTMNLELDPIVGRQQVNETQARYDLEEFLNQRGLGYSGGISSPNQAFVHGSRLSTHLAWGTLGIRTAFHETMARVAQLKEDKSPEAVQWRKSLRAFQSRLHWHDHFIQRLESAPSMEFTALNPAYKDVQYLNEGDEYQARLAAWREGTTGMPMIDACMRCLMTTGFLNFRMRAMLVTTACFGLQLHWRDLLHPLAQVFADYEPGIHISQIQMQAGMVGINTLRVYSPHKQLIDQDPDAEFVRRWIPELAKFDAKDIAKYDTRTLGDYPAPITDIKSNSKIIKDQLYKIRRSEEGKEAAQATLELHGSRLSANDRQWGSFRKKSKKAIAKKAVAKKAVGEASSKAAKSSNDGNSGKSTKETAGSIQQGVQQSFDW